MSGSKLEKILDISLDDYIAKKGIVSSLRQKSTDSSGQSIFKRPMRSEMDDDENGDDLMFEDRVGNRMDTEDPPIREVTQNNEVEDADIEEIGFEKKPTNVSIRLDSERECRTFITEEKKRGIKQLPSQQWRLRRENQVSKKPSGVPPLMSVKAVFDRNTEQLIASLGENAKFHNADAKERATQQLHNNKRQWNNNRNQNQYRNRYNNGFQNRNHHNNNNRKNANRPSGFIQNVSSAQMDKNQIKDLRPFISPPSSMLQPQSTAGSGLWRPLDQPQQLVTFADMLSQIGQAADNRNRETFANVIRNVMQQQQQPQQSSPAALVPLMTADTMTRMNPTELMPFAAQTMLNHIATVQQNFGPKYDLKLQKEIHTLQGKPMFYGNGVVVSSDGTGVDNERVKPVTTDLSMNMRFS